MRILQISSALTYGGGERHLVDLSRGLHEAGHEVYVALRPTNQWQGHLRFLPEERLLHASIRNSFGMFSANRLAKFLRRNKIDILHAHVARDYLAASIAARKAKDVKLVLTRHVMFPMKAFHRFALRNVDAAIAVSPAVRRQLERIFSADTIRVIPNGIAIDTDADADRRSELVQRFRFDHDIPLTSPLVVSVGELKPLKGQRDLVLAANELLKKMPDVHFVIAGKDNTIDKKFRRELKRLVRVFGIEENFLWLDWLEDLRPMLAAADIFVSPSHSESFGLAILEAMAAGTAVVATDTDGARELMSGTGALVPVKDPLALAAKLETLLSDRDTRERLGADLAASAKSRFGIERMLASTTELYTELLSK